jgi:hypothetical protein
MAKRFARAGWVLTTSTLLGRILDWRRSVGTKAQCPTRRSVAGRRIGRCAVHRFRHILDIGRDRLCAKSRQLERMRPFGLRVSTPNGRTSLCFDFFSQTRSDELRRNLLRRTALQVWRNRQETILALRRCAEQLLLPIAKFG